MYRDTSVSRFSFAITMLKKSRFLTQSPGRYILILVERILLNFTTSFVKRNFCSVIRWHSPCRGGYQPPGCFPSGETTSAQSADNGTTEHLKMKFGGIMSKHRVFATLLHHPANSVLLKNLQRWRADDIRPYAVCATELPMQIFRCATEVLRDLLYKVRAMPARRRG